MPLAYFTVEASRAFWEEHWAGQDLGGALRVAETSPLTAAIEAALPREGRVLEAGCGLGQYVILLRRRGWKACGVDWSVDALRRTRAAVPPTPLAAMDLGELAFRPATFVACISLGVVEHDPGGPDRILREARRILASRGVLVVSVPYVNVARRLGAWWIRLRNRARARRGASFYQFAFRRAEFRACLERHGFRVTRAWPYDPARAIRRWMPAPAAGGDRPRATARRRSLLRLARRVLYAPPTRALLGHMILFVAVRDPDAR